MYPLGIQHWLNTGINHHLSQHPQLQLLFPIVSAKFYNSLPEGIKATALSFNSVIESLASCIGLILFGFIGNNGVHHVFLAASVVMILTSVFVLIVQQLPSWPQE